VGGDGGFVSEQTFKVHAVVRHTVQIGPEDWEVYPIIVDVDDDTTVREIWERLEKKTGISLHSPHPVTLVY
jgi:predicted transcriptional regulator